MTCQDCGRELPSASAFCLDCGARLETRAGSAAAKEPAGVQNLLSRANLLRVRGQWEAAAEQCAAVMRLEPQNAAAHSLLGEIYDNQGRLEQAIRWYEEALELNPQSVADRAKLARARELQGARQRRPATRPQPAFSWLRVAGGAGAIICGGIILLAVLFARGTPTTPATPTQPPAVLWSRPNTGTPPRWLTTQEREVGSQVAMSVPEPMQLGTLQIDPSDPSVEIGLVLDLPTYTANRTGMAARSHLMLDGYAIAHRAFEVYPGARRVDLRIAVRTQNAEGRPIFDYLFIGSLSADALTANPRSITVDDVRMIYRKVWWSPSIPL